MCAVLESLSTLSPALTTRSAWLSHLHEAAQELGDTCPPAIEMGMLLAIARTALAARQVSAGLVAAEQALQRAVELGDAVAQVRARLVRLPWLAQRAPAEAARELAIVDAAAAHLTDMADADRRWLQAELLLAHVACLVARREPHALGPALAQLARLQLPPRLALASVALASQHAVVQLGLRSGQRQLAATALQEALRLCEQEAAFAEMGNLRSALAALAVRDLDFASARQQALAATAAAANTARRPSEPDPWLGLTWDAGSSRTPADAVQVTAEGVLLAQDRIDAEGLVMAAAALTACYLADDRVDEAIDSLAEAAAAADAMGADQAAAELRQIASALHSHRR
jgi:hypothetical protein